MTVFADSIQQANAKPVVLAVLALTSDWKFTSAGYPLFGYPNIISSVSPLQSEIDPVTREFACGSMSISVADDGAFRAVVAGNHLKGKKITVKLGTEDIDETEYVTLWTGYVDEITWGEGEITITIAHIAILASEKKLTGMWTNAHPAAIAEEILIRSGIPAANLIEFSDPYGTKDTAISHLVVSHAECNYTGGTGKGLAMAGALADATVTDRLTIVSVKGLDQTNSTNNKMFPTIYKHNNFFQIVFFNRQTTGVDGKDPVPVCYIDHTAGSDAYNVRKVSIPCDSATWWDTEGYTEGNYPTVPEIEVRINDVALVSRVSLYVNCGTPSDSYFGYDWDDISADNYLQIDVSTLPDALSPLDACNELARLCNASIMQKSDGTLKFVPFDKTASASANWTTDDIFDLQCKDSISNVINEVRWNTKLTLPSRSYGLTEDEDVEEIITFKRATSQSNYSLDGGTTPRVFAVDLSSDWLGGKLGITSTAIDTDDTAVTVSNTANQNHGMCGTGGYAGGGSQDADAQMAASRIAYFMFWRHGLQDFREIIKCTASDVNADGLTALAWNPYTEVTDTDFMQFPLELTTIARAQLGTSAKSHLAYSYILDITIQQYVAEYLLNRFEAGCPIVTCETNLSQHVIAGSANILEVGLFVTITHDAFLGYGNDGITSSTKFEIVSKEIDPLGSPPRIKWTLARVAPAANTSSTHDLMDRFGLIPPWLDQPPTSDLGSHKGIVGGVQFHGPGGIGITEDDDNFHYDGPNKRLGIGTNAPEEVLHVKAATGAPSIIVDQGGTVKGVITADSNGFVGVGAYTNHPLSLQVNSSDAIYVNTDMDVGVGTGSPAAATRLHVYDTAGCTIMANDYESSTHHKTVLSAKSTGGYCGTTTNDKLQMLVNNAEHTDLLVGGAYESVDDVADPTTPASGYIRWWFYGGKIHILDDAAKEVTLDIEAKADAAQAAWINVNDAGGSSPALENNWVNYNTSTYHQMSYRKDTLGFVHVRGVIKDGTGTQFFTLPSGYRPAKACAFAVASNSAFGYVDIAASGTMTLTVGTSAWVHLGEIIFATD